MALEVVIIKSNSASPHFLIDKSVSKPLNCVCEMSLWPNYLVEVWKIGFNFFLSQFKGVVVVLYMPLDAFKGHIWNQRGR